MNTTYSNSMQRFLQLGFFRPEHKAAKKTLRTPRGWFADKKSDLFILLFLLLSISTIYDFLVALYESFCSLIPSRKYTSVS